MIEPDEKDFFIHKVIPNTNKYSFDQKLMDLISLSLAPGLSGSNAIYKKIQRKIESDNRYILKKAEKLRSFKMNSFDEHIFNSSQMSKGVLTQNAIYDYTERAFTSDEMKGNFLDYVKVRLGYLSYLGLLNDISEDNKFREEKVKIFDGKKHIEHTVRNRINFQYEVNTLFHQYYKLFIKEKAKQEKDSFKFSNVHKFIIKFCRNNEFNVEAYRQYIGKKLHDDDLEREIKWKKSSLDKLTRVGYFIKTDENIYRLTDMGIEKLKEILEVDKAARLQKHQDRFSVG